MIDYEKEYELTKPSLDKEISSDRFVFANSMIKKGDSVLEVGCNAGYLMKHIDKKIIYFGIDISKSAIKDNPYPCKVGNAENFRVGKKFDKIVCLETIEHLENPDKAIKNMFNHLKKGGLLIITTPRNNWIPDPSHLHIFTYKRWKDICETYTSNYSIKPIKKHKENTEKILFSVTMEK